MVPAIPMGCAALSHRLDEDAQLLQAHVRPGPHANDADAQALGVCGTEAVRGRGSDDGGEGGRGQGALAWGLQGTE